MLWIFRSFLVTPCALANCHILISKQQRDQGTRVQQVCNRKETIKWEPRDQIYTESESWEGHAAEQRRLCWACKGMQALAPSDSQKKIWEEEVLFTHLSPQKHQPFRE